MPFGLLSFVSKSTIQFKTFSALVGKYGWMDPSLETWNQNIEWTYECLANLPKQNCTKAVHIFEWILRYFFHGNALFREKAQFNAIVCVVNSFFSGPKRCLRKLNCEGNCKQCDQFWLKFAALETFAKSLAF